MTQILTELKETQLKIIVGDFNNLLSIMDKTTRQRSIKKERT